MEYVFDYLGRQIIVQVDQDVNGKYVASAVIKGLDGQISLENVIMLEGPFDDAEQALTATLKEAQESINAE